MDESPAEVASTTTAGRSCAKLKLGPSGSARLPLRLLRPEMSCDAGKDWRQVQGWHKGWAGPPGYRAAGA